MDGEAMAERQAVRDVHFRRCWVCAAADVGYHAAGRASPGKDGAAAARLVLRSRAMAKGQEERERGWWYSNGGGIRGHRRPIAMGTR